MHNFADMCVQFVRICMHNLCVVPSEAKEFVGYAAKELAAKQCLSGHQGKCVVHTRVCCVMPNNV